VSRNLYRAGLSLNFGYAGSHVVSVRFRIRPVYAWGGRGPVGCDAVGCLLEVRIYRRDRGGTDAGRKTEVNCRQEVQSDLTRRPQTALAIIGNGIKAFEKKNA
jgi:hypothetical protein